MTLTITYTIFFYFFLKNMMNYFRAFSGSLVFWHVLVVEMFPTLRLIAARLITTKIVVSDDITEFCELGPKKMQISFRLVINVKPYPLR